MLDQRPALLGVAAELHGIRTAAALHHHAFEEISAEAAVDLAQGSVERERGGAVVADGRWDQNGVLWKRRPVAEG